MLKKKVIPIAKNSIGLKCGDCLNFALNAKFEKPCKDLGVKRFSDAPSCYSPNVYLLGRKNPDVLHQLGLLLKDFTAQDQRVFISLLKQSKAFEKHYELRFGQPVYFCIGDDYLSNFYAGYCIGVAETGEGQVFISSDLQGKQRGKPLVGTFIRDSVFTVTQFKKKRAQLQKADRILDPKPMFATQTYTPAMAKVDYTPPSMDTAPEAWFYKDKPLKKKGKDARLSSKNLKRSKDGTVEFHVTRK
jgi:hypothetical protein